MVSRTRSNTGKFETLTKTLDTDGEPMLSLIPRGWVPKIVFVLFLVFVVSPWMFLIVKKNSISTVAQKINDFYDDSFSCKMSATATESDSNSKLKENLTKAF